MGEYIVECEDNGSNDQMINGETIIKKVNSKATVFHGLYFRSEKNGFGIEYDDKGNSIYEG